MIIGGFQELSLVDYPGKVAATVFLVGCNFRCPYCHNPELVDPEKIKKQPKIKQEDVFKLLDERKDFLDGVCITGGEPTLQKGLIGFIKKIKKKGFLVKLDTNGSDPAMLRKLIKAKLLDYIAMDIKADLPNYEKASGVKANLKNIKKSIDLIKKSKIDYEFRITVAPKLIKKKAIQEIAKLLKGAKKFAIQQFRNEKVLDKAFEKIEPYTDKTIKDFEKILKKTIKKVEVRL
jgi:pyruvate formate lyase activating enzyme